MQLPTIDIKGKEYVQVKDRVLYFNEKYEKGSIVTEITYEGELVRCKAIVRPDFEQVNRVFTGHSEELRDSTPINKTSAVENCETSAVGRALALMGIGVIESIASADEVKKAINRETYVKDKTCSECGKPSGNYSKCYTCNNPVKKVVKPASNYEVSTFNDYLTENHK